MSQANYEERKQARIDRLNKKAEKASKASEQLYNESKKMADVIPCGQPILIGHHSERSDRNFRNRIHNKMKKSVEEADKSEYYEKRARAAESNQAISSDDPKAIEKLQLKIEQAQKKQEIMKACNKIVKNKKLSNDEKILKIMDLNLTSTIATKLLQPDYMGHIGFPAYAIQNNNANISRMKKRLESLKISEMAETKEKEYNGFKVVENVEENRIQLIFDYKPDYETRSLLKRNGFRWSHYNKAWQRHLNNLGRYAAQHFIKQIETKK